MSPKMWWWAACWLYIVLTLLAHFFIVPLDSDKVVLSLLALLVVATVHFPIERRST